MRRDGSWRYWRTLEGGAGMVAVMRLEIGADGQILGYGVNPRGSEPEFDTKQPVAGGEGPMTGYSLATTSRQE